MGGVYYRRGGRLAPKEYVERPMSEQSGARPIISIGARREELLEREELLRMPSVDWRSFVIGRGLGSAVSKQRRFRERVFLHGVGGLPRFLPVRR